MSRSTSSTRTGPARQLRTVPLPEQLAEVFQLHPPTLPDPAARHAPTDAGDQLALPLFLLLEGGGG